VATTGPVVSHKTCEVARHWFLQKLIDACGTKLGLAVSWESFDLALSMFLALVSLY